jgi:Replication initiator protein, pSAM2
LPAAGLVARDLVARAAHPKYGRWAEQLAATGYCARPIRLAGRIHQVDLASGELREVYSTDREPDGVLLTACGNRRASRCMSCSQTYRGDAYQVISAGLAGGKGIPGSVAGHPRVFVTLTAPSFGPVHTIRERGGRLLPCHPRDPQRRCEHDRPLACHRRHLEREPELGEPICGDCHDYQAQVLWNALAPELWRRTTIYLYRALARLTGTSEAAVKRLVRVRYAKVAEYQRRGVIHYHAILRLDAAPPPEDPERVAPPPAGFTLDLLARAIRLAVHGAPGFHPVAVPAPVVGVRLPLVAAWGAQLDVRPIDEQGELSAERVAGYVAKYATKGTEAAGAALDHRLVEEELDALAVRPHVARVVRVCWELGGHPDLKQLRLRQWAHQLGYRGHWQTKSRRYSTTFGALRRARAEHARAGRLAGVTELDAWRRPLDPEVVLEVNDWRYAGSGHRTIADAWLAASAAARAREQRCIAREELTSTVPTVLGQVG